jgi:hypothetical protein
MQRSMRVHLVNQHYSAQNDLVLVVERAMVIVTRFRTCVSVVLSVGLRISVNGIEHFRHNIGELGFGDRMNTRAGCVQAISTNSCSWQRVRCCVYHCYGACMLLKQSRVHL